MVKIVEQFVEIVSFLETGFLGNEAVIALEELTRQPEDARDPQIVLVVPEERAGIEND